MTQGLTWTKDLPEPPHGMDILLDLDDTGDAPYLCRWSANGWFWERHPQDVAQRGRQTPMTWQFAASQARGPLLVVRL